MPKPIVFLWLAVLMTPTIAPGQPAVAGESPAADFVAAGPVEPLPEPLASALVRIRAAALAAHVRFLASPPLAGRGLGTSGLDAATEYVAATLAQAGVPPLVAGGGPGDYFQPVPLREIGGAGGEIIVERRRGETAETRTFLSGVDCAFAEATPRTLSAPVVFAGLGIREPDRGHDDYRGLDVRDRIVLVLPGLPDGAEWRGTGLAERYGKAEHGYRWAAKLDAARTAGAAAVLAVEDQPVAGRPADEEGGATHFFLPFADDEPSRASSTPLVRVSRAVAAALLSRVGGGPASEAGRVLPGVSATIRITGDERSITSRNVLGVIRGADPGLSDRAVVVGAHMDHLGEIGGSVYPGADDNASGVAALLEVSRVLADMPAKPRRTIVVAFWTGEEEGKLGSGHFVRHPLWPLQQIVAYVNLDMIGHPWLADEIRNLVHDTGLSDGGAFLSGLAPADFAEVGLPRGVPALPAALRRAARGTGLALHLDYTDGTSGGSDYRDFARAGVPFLRFFGNFFPAYHEPGDTADALDPTQVQRIARLALATVWELANYESGRPASSAYQPLSTSAVP